MRQLTRADGRRDYDGDLELDDAAAVFHAREARFRTFVWGLLEEQQKQWRADGTWQDLVKMPGYADYIAGFREAIEDNLTTVIKKYVAQLLVEAFDGLPGKWRVIVKDPKASADAVPMNEDVEVQVHHYGGQWFGWVIKQDGRFKDVLKWLEKQPR